MLERNKLEKYKPALKIEDDPIIRTSGLNEVFDFGQVRQFFEEFMVSAELEIEKDPVGYIYKPHHLTLPFLPLEMVYCMGRCFFGLKEAKKFFILMKEAQKIDRNIAKTWGTIRCTEAGQPVLEVHILHTTNVHGAVELRKWAEMAHELGYDPSQRKK